MKKIILFFSGLLLSGMALGQTFPVTNLTVGGTSSFAGQATFTLSPTGPTPAPGDVSTKFATTSFISSAISGVSTVVANNAALVATPTTATAQIWRMGFAVEGDAPPLLYVASNSACTLNAGAGDSGSQVAATNGMCWIASFGPGPADVREWGAKADGTTNNTSAMQAAANTGKLIYYPGSSSAYEFTNITMTGGGIVGDGPALSQLLSTDTTSTNAIVYSANSVTAGFSAPIFQDFTLESVGGKSGGAAILLTAPSTENSGAQFTRLTILQFPTDISFIAADFWAIQNCVFENYTTAGVIVANNYNNDHGDSVIIGSLFSSAAGSGILYNSSGGLKVTANKFLGGSYGISLGLTAVANTSDLLFNNNSVEGMSGAAVSLTRTSGSATFTNVLINGNQFAGDANGVVTDTSGAFGNVMINDNVMTLSSGSGDGIGLNAVSTFHIGGNLIVSGGGTPTGISISSTNANGLISPNMFVGMTNNIINASGSTTVVTVP